MSKEQQTNISKEPAPGDGIRSMRSTGLFRAVNFELYAKPVSKSFNSTEMNKIIEIFSSECSYYGCWHYSNSRLRRVHRIHAIQVRENGVLLSDTRRRDGSFHKAKIKVG